MLSVPSKPDKARVDSGEVYSLPPSDHCDDCGYALAEHVTVPGYRGLIRLCNGDLVEPV